MMINALLVASCSSTKPPDEHSLLAHQPERESPARELLRGGTLLLLLRRRLALGLVGQQAMFVGRLGG